MPRAADLPKIERIFLSATATDCLAYREAVKAAVEGNLRAAKIFLQEKWALNAETAVKACKDRLLDCDAYVGLFGHRYGHIAPGQTISITEQEFRWAVEHWPHLTPPIFILRAKPGSEADTFLRAQAEQCWHTLPTPEAVEADRSAQQRFVAAVTDWSAEEGRVLNFYADLIELRDKAQACINHWNLDLLEAALDGRYQATGEIPAAELGRLGRKPQFTAFRDSLDTFRERRDQRAVAFLVHGPENHGQPQFMEALAQWTTGKDGMEVFAGQASEPDSAESLICWLCSRLNEPLLGEPTVDALARILAKRLERRTVVVLLHTVGREAQRLALFHQRFWQPLADALAALKPGGRSRFICVVADHAPLPAAPGAFIRPADPDDADTDYRQLLALPALAPLNARQVRSWLADLEDAGIVLDDDRRDAIAEHATTPDGLPPNVYYRLNLEGFWKHAR